ncbi:MAG: hypothetical protein PHQ89_00520 [Bacilli bacterium]|nr:hypothetical protein [Bacilli bacterium]
MDDGVISEGLIFNNDYKLENKDIVNEQDIIDLFNKKRIFSQREIKILIKYIIDQENELRGLNTKLQVINLISIIKDSFKGKNFSLKKINHEAGFYGSFFSNNLSDGLVLVNIDHYYWNAITFNLLTSNFLIINTCYHEMRHAIQNHDTKINLKRVNLSLEEYIKFRDNYIHKNDQKFYGREHNQFYDEIDASLYSVQKTLEFIKKYDSTVINLISISKKILNTVNMYIDDKTMYEPNNRLFKDKLDEIIKQKQIESPDNFLSSFFEFEYNSKGERKNLTDIITTNDNNKINMSYELFNYFVVDAIVSGDSLDYEKLDTKKYMRLLDAISYGKDRIRDKKKANDENLINNIIDPKLWEENNNYLIGNFNKIDNFFNQTFTNEIALNKINENGHYYYKKIIKPLLVKDLLIESDEILNILSSKENREKQKVIKKKINS